LIDVAFLVPALAPMPTVAPHCLVVVVLAAAAAAVVVAAVSDRGAN